MDPETIDWDAIKRGTATATNYRVMPGDRIFVRVADNGSDAVDNGEVKDRHSMARDYHVPAVPSRIKTPDPFLHLQADCREAGCQADEQY